jgi:3-oxoacyl-[acyl-carrier-protein] synthase-3
LNLEPGWIFRKTGIRERRVASESQATSDLATEAAHRALVHADITLADVDLIVVATSSPDWIQPATACAVQHQLGAAAAAFDVNAVCSGFVYALAMATAALQVGSFEHALVIGSETYSRILDYQDQRSAVLFGDGAGAVLLGPVRVGEGISSIALGADGSKIDLVQIPAGGSRRPATRETIAAREHFFRMDGRGVREYVRETCGPAVGAALERAGLTIEDVDLVVPHQANRVMLDECFTHIGVPLEKAAFTIERYGNTAAASIPLTLDELVRVGRVRPGDAILLVAFGGGMTWGSAIMRVPRSICASPSIVAPSEELATAQL